MAPAEIPRGSKLVRVVKIEVQTKAMPDNDGNSGKVGDVDAPTICPPAERSSRAHTTISAGVAHSPMA
jgi:hypothetical protein